jgi:DHA3 family macrolide efflux protein-like MFS transporter
MSTINDYEKMPKLWNRNFTILIVGSFISMLGYTCAVFTLSLFVYDQSNQIMLFALVQIASMLARLIAPMIAGTFFDRHSRCRAIYKLDYCYTALFALISLLLYLDKLHYAVIVVAVLLIGSIDGIYMVAFDSCFPLLTTTKTARQAFSVNSMLYPIASFITMPFTLWFYDSIGPLTIFIGSTILFAITATVETLIKFREPHMMAFQPEKQMKLEPSPKEIEMHQQGLNILDTVKNEEKRNFYSDFKEGVRYISSEKGLLAITIYFFVINLCSGIYGTLTLPFFRSASFTFDFFGKQVDGMTMYLVIFGLSTLGRLVGANVQYRVKFRRESRFNVAMIVYITTNVIMMILYHIPPIFMALLALVEGTLSVTSYNIRISSTQQYVPDSKRGRFNGVFLFFNILGSILGQLIAGSIGDTAWYGPNLFSTIVTIVYGINLIAAFAIMLPAKKKVSLIYNTDL